MSGGSASAAPPEPPPRRSVPFALTTPRVPGSEPFVEALRRCLALADAESDLGRGARAFALCAAAFLFAGTAVAAVHFVVPITRGWWLAAYLILVGGVSQAALGVGLAALAPDVGSRLPGRALTGAQLVVFDAGTVLVAVADLADAPAGVLAGSVLLVIALALFAAALRRLTRSARRPAPIWVTGYALLLGFLAGSVVVGAALAGALPGQWQ